MHSLTLNRDFVGVHLAGGVGDLHHGEEGQCECTVQLGQFDKAVE